MSGREGTGVDGGRTDDGGRMTDNARTDDSGRLERGAAMAEQVRAALSRGPLLFDGAMGTWYAALHQRSAEGCDLANLDHPEDIAAIHRAYLDSGCRAVKTNTFAVSQYLARGKKETRWRRMLEAGCRIALDAASPYGAFVFADMGPAPEDGALPPGETYRRQAEVFLEQGLTCFLAETLPSDAGIPELIAYIRERCPRAFVLVSFAVGTDGMTRDGFTAKELLDRMASAGADAAGFNCVSGPEHLLQLVRKLDAPSLPLSVMPNAGYPAVMGRRTVFQGQPDYFGEKLAAIAGAGASIVGGCCGTTPAYMAAAAAALRNPVPLPARPAGKPEASDAVRDDPFGAKLEAGRRVIAVELDPPPDDAGAYFLDGARTLRDAGADIITIADCPVGRARADSCLMACKLKRDAGVEPLPHMTCRDRNLNATKALLLGLAMEGVHNVLLVTGDPIPSESRDEIKSVFNFNSRKLARYVRGLYGTSLRTPFRVFGALNVNARNFEFQLASAREKEENGMAGFLTQPVLSPEALDNLKRAREVLHGKILGGIFPVVSYRNACFLNNEVAGIRVSEEIVRRYEGKSREEGEELAVELSLRTAEEIAPWTDGLYLMTPFRRVSLMTRILGELR